jgi:hypothetical protein
MINGVEDPRGPQLQRRVQLRVPAFLHVCTISCMADASNNPVGGTESDGDGERFGVADRVVAESLTVLDTVRSSRVLPDHVLAWR